MNKIITKLSGLFLGLAMMVGAGVGVSTTKISEVRATGTTVDIIEAADLEESVTLNAATNPYQMGETPIKLTGIKGTSNFPALNYNATKGVDLRFYKGTTCGVTFEADDCNITKIEFLKNAETPSALGTPFSANNGTLTGNVWQGNAASITFTYSANDNFKEQIYIINVTYDSSTTPTKELVSLTVSGALTETSYNVGDTLDPTGLVVTGTYEDASTEIITSGIQWTFDPEEFSLGDTYCDVVASVGDVDSEVYRVNGITVTTFDGYVKITDVTQITVGDSYVIASPTNNALLGGLPEGKKFLSSVDGSSVISSDKAKIDSALPEGTSVVTFIYSDENEYYLYDITKGVYYNFSTGAADTTAVTTCANATKIKASFKDSQINLDFKDTNRAIGFNASANPQRFASYQNSTTYNTIALYKKTGSLIKTNVLNFTNTYLKMNDPAYEGDITTPNCAANYNSMKTAYASLSEQEKNVLQFADDYVAARARLDNWAKANGEVFNASTSSFMANSRFGNLIYNFNDSNSTWIIVVISVVGLSAIGGFFFYRKRKENY